VRCKNAFWTTAVLLLYLLFLLPGDLVSGAEPEPKVYEDGKDDVYLDNEKEPIESVSALDDLEKKKAPDTAERTTLDILSLTVTGDDTHVRFLLEMDGYVEARPEYTYVIAGYAKKDPKRTDKFDFLLRFHNGTTSHLVWGAGMFEIAENVSNVTIDGSILNITIHRSKFSLVDRADPYALTAFVYLEGGEDGDRIIDYLLTTEKKDESNGLFDPDMVLILQISFLFLLFATLLIIYNIWSKKKGEEFSGGVCPKCESRLDPNLDFCPSCGIVIRGPDAEPEPGKVQLPPEE